MSELRRHGLRDSALFRVRTRKRLAEVLQTSPAALERLLSTGELYERRWKLKTDEVWLRQAPPPDLANAYRPIDIPNGTLKRLQSRVADLLMRIEPPVWLFSPVKGRSYVDNAAYHRGGKAFFALDIADYFSNCSARCIAHFLRVTMECTPDVTAILTKVTTKDGMLPQGSPCSPILAYFASREMWAEVMGVSDAFGIRASLYADDLTLSGDQISGEAIWEIRKIVHKHGHRFKAEKAMSMIGKAADITGCIVNGDTILLPNRQHQRLFELRRQWHETEPSKRLSLERRINGRLAQRRQVEQA